MTFPKDVKTTSNKKAHTHTISPQTKQIKNKPIFEEQINMRHHVVSKWGGAIWVTGRGGLFPGPQAQRHQGRMRREDLMEFVWWFKIHRWWSESPELLSFFLFYCLPKDKRGWLAFGYSGGLWPILILRILGCFGGDSFGCENSERWSLCGSTRSPAGASSNESLRGFLCDVSG